MRTITKRSTSSEPAGLMRWLQMLPWRRLVRQLSVVTTVGMFLVLVMGTLVTNTKSEQGCGKSWPLCHGKFIPDFAVSTFIEFSHRGVVGIETLLVLAMAAGVLWFWRSRREIQILAPAMVIFLFAQAALGAAAVMYPETPEVLALHFGVSLLSFASILLTTLLIFEFDGWDYLRDRGVAKSFRWLVWGLAVYSYVVVYIGAYVRHRGVEYACRDWPLCNGQVMPGFAGGVGLVFTHRVAALVLMLGTVGLVIWAWRLRAARPDFFWGSVVALVAVLLQALEGAYVVWSKVSVVSTLGHGAVVALLFGALCYLCLRTLARPAAARKSASIQAREAQALG